MPKAYSYARWSTPEQSRGDSLRRQTEAAEKWAAANGYELDAMVDAGVSAFRGSNAGSGGALGTFVEACRAGLIPPGSVLLVENLDRISRMPPRAALNLFGDIVDNGVEIITLNDGQRYTAARLDTDPTSLLVSIMVAWRAHDESRTKGRRVAAAWEAKRKRLREGDPAIYTRRAPAWLELREGQWAVNEAKAAAVREVFKLTRAGWGEHRIAQELNRRGVPPIGQSNMWRRSSVVKILRNPAVIGNAQLGRMEDRDGRRVRVTDGVVEGVFPAVVSAEDWHAVTAIKTSAPMPKGRHGASPPSHALAGLARCPLCGSAMTRVMKGNPAKAGRPKLVCTRAKVGAGCAYHGVTVDAVETAIRRGLGQKLADPPAGKARPDLDARWDELQSLIGGAEDTLTELVEEHRRSSSRELARQISRLEVRLAELEAEAASLQQERETVAYGLVAHRARQLWDDLEAGEAAGQPVETPRLNAALRSIFSGVVIDYPEGLLRFDWKHGGEPAWVFFALPAAPAGEAPESR